MARAQSKLGSLVEAAVNTVASMAVFLGFGLPLEIVMGLTFGMLIKNLVIRRLFHVITQGWRR